jgi:hypothetical protein
VVRGCVVVFGDPLFTACRSLLLVSIDWCGAECEENLDRYHQWVITTKLIRVKKQWICCRYNNFRKIICTFPEDGSIEPKHVAMKRISSNKG